MFLMEGKVAALGRWQEHQHSWLLQLSHQRTDADRNIASVPRAYSAPFKMRNFLKKFHVFSSALIMTPF
jgi:hypothetical protein